MSSTSLMSSLSSLESMVSIFACLFFLVVHFIDTRVVWQTRKTALVSLLSFKLLVTIALSAIETQDQADINSFTEVLTIGLLSFQIKEIVSSSDLSRKAYNGTWVIMASTEALTIAKLTLLPHPSIIVPICLLLAVIQFFLSCASIVLSVQAKRASCNDNTTRENTKYDSPWNQWATTKIYYHWSKPTSRIQWVELVTFVGIECFETHAIIKLIEKNWITQQATSWEGQEPSSQRTFLSDSIYERFVKDLLPALSKFLNERYLAAYEARVEKFATLHITLLDKQSFSATTNSKKRAAIQQSPCATIPIRTMLTVLLGVYRGIHIITWLYSSYQGYTTIAILAIIVLKLMVGWIFTKKISRNSKERFDLMLEKGLRRDDIWEGHSTLDLVGQLHREANGVCKLIDQRLQITLKGINYDLLCDTVTGFMNWCGKVIPPCLAFGLEILNKNNIRDSEKRRRLVELSAKMEEAASSLLAAPRMISDAHCATESLRHMITIQPTKQYGSKVLQPGKGNIRVNGLSFVVEGGRTLLNNINWFVKPGAKVAIVGRSGSGKSTFASLLAGQIDPTEGSVEIDGQDISSLKRNEVPRQVVTLSQVRRVFNRSFGENIRIGRPDATSGEIAKAAEDAQLHSDIISYDKAYDSLVDQNGSHLSGGQKQRLGIAGVLVHKDHRIYILDEPFTALDPITEEKIFKTMQSSLSGSTVLLITHQLHRITGFDQICCLTEDGGAEIGSHTQLLAMSGHYKDLWDCCSAQR